MNRKMNRRMRLLVLAVLMLALLLPVSFVYAEDSSADTGYLESVMDMIKDKYNGSITEDKLLEGSLKGMFGTMDPYTTFYTPTETDTFMGNLNGSFVGIGIEMGLNGQYVQVSKVFEASPAEKAGILPGDKIIEAAGKSLIGKSLEDAAALIMGEEGSVVKIGVSRSGSKSTLYFNITRAVIKVSPVFSEIRNGIGYIKLEMFNANTGEFFTKALEKMDQNKVTKIILDLRDNPGGEVNQAIEVARNFVPKGKITTLDFKTPSFEDTVYTSALEKPKYKLAVLVNGMSASASEIVSGAIQDTKAGTLIGTKTFGKAKVQSILPVLTKEAYEKYSKQLGIKSVDGFELSTKYGVQLLESDIAGYTKITTGYYYTPKGRMIDGTGIVPDVVVADPKQKAPVDVGSIGKLTGTVKLKTGTAGAEVYNAEKLLKLLGYAVASPDTRFDQETKNAVKKFQQKVKLSSDGIIGTNTRKALNEELSKAMLKYDPQYVKAIEVLNK